MCGSFAKWDYHYDRNAFASSVIVDYHALAITEAGHILRFALGSLALEHELLSPDAALVWGPAQSGSVLVGFAGGHIAHLHAQTFALDDVGDVPGDPLWIGQIAAPRQTVVAYQTLLPADAPRFARAPHRIRILETGREIALPDLLHPSTYLIDRGGHLWMGEDRGEWGGTVHVVDLLRVDSAVSKVSAPAPSAGDAGFDGVYGFAEVDPGVVLVFGGTSHKSLARAFVDELTFGAPPKRIFYNDNDRGRPASKPNLPVGPISHIIPAGADRFIALSYNDLFETNRTFANWRRIARAPARGTWGRPDAMGSYPAILSCHVLDDRLVLATKRDGYIELANGSVVPHALPNQIGLAANSMSFWEDALLVSAEASDSRRVPMAFQDGRWRLARDAIVPPFLPSAVKSEDGYPLDWGHVFWGRDGDALWIVARESKMGGGRSIPARSGRLVVGKRTRDSFEVLGDEITTLEPDAVYAYPNGEFVATRNDESLIFKNHRWQPIDPSGTDRQAGAHVARHGSGHIVRMVSDGDFSLALYDPTRKPSLAPLGPELPVKWGLSELNDVLAWDHGHLLLATRKSVRLWDIDRSTFAPFQPAPPSGAVEVLARDATGRIWLGGRGLFALDEKGELVRFDADAPFLKNIEVSDIVSDRDRLGLLLGRRGLAIVNLNAVGAGHPCRAQ